MRSLMFQTIGQQLKPIGDFSGLVIGSKGYLFASFIFDEAHKDCKHIAVFTNAKGTEEYPVELDDNNSCEIPSSILQKSVFNVSVVSVKPDYRVQTRKVQVVQDV